MSSGCTMGHSPVSAASTPEMHDLSLGRPDGQPGAEPLPHRRRPGAPPATADAHSHVHVLDGPPPPRAVDVRARRRRRAARHDAVGRARDEGPRRGPPRPAAARPPCPGRRPGPNAGACSTRCTGPSGGKSELASSGVISATSPGERRSTELGEGGEPGVLVLAQAEGEQAAARRSPAGVTSTPSDSSRSSRRG